MRANGARCPDGEMKAKQDPPPGKVDTLLPREGNMPSGVLRGGFPKVSPSPPGPLNLQGPLLATPQTSPSLAGGHPLVAHWRHPGRPRPPPTAPRDPAAASPPPRDPARARVTPPPPPPARAPQARGLLTWRARCTASAKASLRIPGPPPPGGWEGPPADPPPGPPPPGPPPPRSPAPGGPGGGPPPAPPAPPAPPPPPAGGGGPGGGPPVL